MKATNCLLIDPLLAELAARPQGFRLSEICALLPSVKRQAISTRLSILGRRGDYATRYVGERESHGDVLAYFATEALADACPGMVKTRDETKVVAYTNVKTCGIKTLEDIRQRCWIDPDTGCWVWKGSFSTHKGQRGRPQASIDMGRGKKRRTVSAARLAWVLSGRTIGDEQVVYRAKCTNKACVFPEHGGCRTQADAMAALAKAGVFKPSIAKKRAARIGGLKCATPVETVREIEAMLAAGMTKTAIAAKVNLCTTTILKIARKRHVHSEGATSVLKSGSVFTFAGKVQVVEHATAPKKAQKRRTYDGTENPNAKLTEQQIQAIAQRYEAIRKQPRIAPSRDAMKWHEPRRGDTVAKIAADHGIQREHVSRLMAKLREAQAA